MTKIEKVAPSAEAMSWRRAQRENAAATERVKIAEKAIVQYVLESFDAGVAKTIRTLALLQDELREALGDRAATRALVTATHRATIRALATRSAEKAKLRAQDEAKAALFSGKDAPRDAFRELLDARRPR